MSDFDWRAELRHETLPPIKPPLLGLQKGKLDGLRHPIMVRPSPRPADKSPRRYSSQEALSELLVALRKLEEGKGLDGRGLQQLADVGEPDAAGCLQFARAVDRQLHERDPSDGSDALAQQAQEDREQLAAHISFLERRVAKLRDKVKRRAASGEDMGSTWEKPAEDEAPDSPIGRLGTEVEELQRQVAEMQAEIGSLTHEKEAAEMQENMARRLVANIEDRFRDAVKSKEAEQAEMLEAQRALQKELAEQGPRLAALDRTRGQRRQLEELQTRLAECNHLLKLRGYNTQQVPKVESPRARDEASAKAPAAEAAAQEEEQQPPAAAEEAPQADEQALVKVEEAAPRGEYADAIEQEQQALDNAKRLLEERADELVTLRAATQRRVTDLEATVQRAVHTTRFSVCQMEMAHSDDINVLQLTVRSGGFGARLSEIPEQPEDVIKRLREEGDEAKWRHAEALAKVRAEATDRIEELQQQNNDQDVAIKQARRDMEIIRREKEVRGSFWLTVRRDSCDLERLQAALAEVLDVPPHLLRILSSDAEVEGRRSGASRADGAHSPTLSTSSAAVPLRGVRQLRRAGRDGPRRPASRQTEADGALGEAESRSTSAALHPAASSASRGAPSTVAGSSYTPFMTEEEMQERQVHQIVLFQVVDNAAAQVPLDSGLRAAEKLLELVSSDDARLEDLAIVRLSVARGELQMAASWPEKIGLLMERRPRSIGHRQLLLTVRSNEQPLLLQISALDAEARHDFQLHLTEADIEVLAPGMGQRPAQEAFDAVVDKLHVVHWQDKYILIALQSAEAMPNATNQLDPVLSEAKQLSPEWRKQQRAAQESRHSQDGVDGGSVEADADVREEEDDLSDDADWQAVREEVLMCGTTFIIFRVEHRQDTGGWRFQGRAAWHAETFRLELAGRGTERQQRAFVQHCQIEKTHLVVMVEETVTPHLLLVRFSEEKAPLESGTCLCLAGPSWGLAEPSLLAMVPENARGRLLRFLLQMPVDTRVAMDDKLNSQALSPKAMRGTLTSHPVWEQAHSRPGTSGDAPEVHIAPDSGAVVLHGHASSKVTETCRRVCVEKQSIVWMGVPLTGGRFIDPLEAEDAITAPRRKRLHAAVHRFDGLNLVMTLEQLADGRGHILTAYHAQSCTTFELSTAARDSKCPEKCCVERTSIAGVPMLFAVAESAFPYSVQALARDLAGSREFRCTVRHDDAFTRLQRSERQLYTRCVEELARSGYIGEPGHKCSFDKMPCGALGELSHHVVPVLSLPFVGASRDLKPILVCDAVLRGEHHAFRISLNKASDAGAFTLGLARDDALSIHLLRLRALDASGEEQPSGLYGEVHDVGGSEMLVLAVLSSASLQIALVELASGKKRNLLVLDANAEDQAPEEPQPMPKNPEVNESLLRMFQALVASPAAALPVTAVASPLALPKSEGAAGKPKATQLLRRTTRKLPSGQPVLVSLVRELHVDGAVRLRVLMYHPVMARETSSTVANPHLDKVLSSLGLPPSKRVTAEEVDARAADIAKQIFASVHLDSHGSKINFHTEKAGALLPPPTR